MSIFSQIRRAAEETGDQLGPAKIIRCWAWVKLSKDEGIPGAFPSETLEYRLKAYGHGAKEPGRQPFLTRPEATIDGINRAMDLFHWLDPILRDAGMVRYRIMTHYYLHHMNCADIALQLGMGEGEVRSIRASMVTMIHRAIKKASAELPLAA